MEKAHIRKTMKMDKQKIGSVSKEVFVQFAFFFASLRELSFFGFRGVLCQSNWLTITGVCQWRNVSTELLLLLLTIALMLLQLLWDHEWHIFFQTCRKNWFVFCFVVLTGISAIWSIEANISLYKFCVLLGSTLIGMYIGHIFDLKELIKRMVWFFVAICGFSFLYVFFLPEGIMSDPFYKGAWTGMFAHRNFLGCFMALGVVIFLVNILSSKRPYKGYFYLNVVMLAVTSFLVFKSKSATGIITAFILALLVSVLFVWLRWGQKMRGIHYIWIILLAVIGLSLVLINLNSLLSLIGRNSSLTGRVPMWEFLFKNVIKQRLWLGYGYGVLWHLEGFVSELTGIVKWGTSVVLGDNGYIDIFLHLGIIGITILLGTIILGFIRGIRHFLKERSILAAFPFLILVYVAVANISLSLILESEIFVWVAALAVLVSIQQKTSATNIKSESNVG